MDLAEAKNMFFDHADRQIPYGSLTFKSKHF